MPVANAYLTSVPSINSWSYADLRQRATMGDKIQTVPDLKMSLQLCELRVCLPLPEPQSQTGEIKRRGL